VDIAVEELKPEHMRGYGEVPPAAAVALNGIAGELHGLVRQLDDYLTRGPVAKCLNDPAVKGKRNNKTTG
jgi:hypothetical protein